MDFPGIYAGTAYFARLDNCCKTRSNRCLSAGISNCKQTAMDSYKTIEGGAEAVFKDKSSKFLAYAWPVEDEGRVKEYLDALRKKYYDATHHCYAWRMGPHGEHFRTNDDGEPSGTAGKPILGQILSCGLTNILIVVVRYFGGTKLGVPGLINAYRESAREVLENCRIVERTVDVHFTLRFAYPAMNGVMRVVKEVNPNVLEQSFDNVCIMRLSIREGEAGRLQTKLEKTEGVEVDRED